MLSAFYMCFLMIKSAKNVSIAMSVLVMNVFPEKCENF